jgi:hypothetical protein
MARKPEKDIRVAATSRLWGFATGMLAICIPLTAVTRSGVILPIAVLLTAAVGTIAVWRKSDNQPRINPLLTNNIKALEQRVANLEIICSSQELDLQSKIKHLESESRD